MNKLKKLFSFLIFSISIFTAQNIFALSVVGLGAENRFQEVTDTTETTTNTHVGPQTYYDIFAGTSYSNFLFLAEYFQGEAVDSGISNFSMNRVQRGAWLSTQIRAQRDESVTPYLSFGFGVIQDQVISNYLGVASTDYSDPAWAVFGGGGIQINLTGMTWKHLYLAAEARLVFGGSLQPQPVLDPMLRLGFSW